MKIVTANLRGAYFEDGEDSWCYRKNPCMNFLLEAQADIYCFQEMLQVQRDEFEAAFTDYQFFGALDRARGGQPMNGMLFRRDRFKVMGSGAYALSDTPHVMGSIGWGNLCPRFVNYLLLQDRTDGKFLRLANTHLDHYSQHARNMEAKQLLEDANSYNSCLPQILTGDMNCDILNEALQTLERGGWRESYAEYTGVPEPGHTYHGFKGPDYDGDNGAQGQGKMDFIFVRGDCQVMKADILRNLASNGRYPSDHYFVTAELVLGDSAHDGLK